MVLIVARRLCVCTGPWFLGRITRILKSSCGVCVEIDVSFLMLGLDSLSVWEPGIGWVGVGRWGHGMRYGIILGCVSVVGGFLMGMLTVRGVVVVVVVVLVMGGAWIWGCLRCWDRAPEATSHVPVLMKGIEVLVES